MGTYTCLREEHIQCINIYSCQTCEDKRFIKEHVISVGYSSQKIIKNPETNKEDKDKSRRIEFRIISK